MQVRGCPGIKAASNGHRRFACLRAAVGMAVFQPSLELSPPGRRLQVFHAATQLYTFISDVVARITSFASSKSALDRLAPRHSLGEGGGRDATWPFRILLQRFVVMPLALHGVSLLLEDSCK